MQSPAPGAALKRLLTPSPKALVRVANYLYSHGLGVRLYDLIALEGAERTLSAYVVEHMQGDPVTLDQYEAFMHRMRGLLGLNELTTVHESVDIMADFAPPDCSNNLVMSTKEGRPLYVDFQGFLFRDEKKFIQCIFEEAEKKEHLGGVLSFNEGGSRPVNGSLPGPLVARKGTESRWMNILELMKVVGFSLHGKVAYDVGCRIGLSLYYALSEGAQWAIGWDLPDVVSSANRVLLGLGATRFDLFGRVIDEFSEFKSDIPDRFRTERGGVLFCLEHGREGFPYGISEIPWEYMFFEGQRGHSYEKCLNRIRNTPWLKNSEVLTQRPFSDGGLPIGVVTLLRRQHRETSSKQ